MSRRHHLGAAVAVALTASALAACGGVGDRPALAEIPAYPNGLADPTDATGVTPAEDAAWAVRAVPLADSLAVFDQPGGAVLVELGPVTDFGTPRVLGVTDTSLEPSLHDGEEWVEVLVPVRPNDLTGWVRVSEVDLQTVDFAVHIDVDARTLWVAERGDVIGSWTVAVGQPDRPTPRGRFFITDKLDTGDPASVWGPYAFGLSAFSDVLTDFIGGIGQVGLHGTNNPSSIGQAASSGCIRLPNDVITGLIELLPLGTPVTIV